MRKRLISLGVYPIGARWMCLERSVFERAEPVSSVGTGIKGRVEKRKTATRAVFEATTGFEPVNGGFADLCLTTWPRRRRRVGVLSEFGSACQLRKSNRCILGAV